MQGSQQMTRMRAQGKVLVALPSNVAVVCSVISNAVLELAHDADTASA